MTYKFNRLDVNQQAIVKTLRKIPGITVQQLNKVKDGCPDLLIGYAGKNYLVEIKQDDKHKLTDDEQAWIVKWTGNVAVCNTANEILAYIGSKARIQ